MKTLNGLSDMTLCVSHVNKSKTSLYGHGLHIETFFSERLLKILGPRIGVKVAHVKRMLNFHTIASGPRYPS